MFRPDKTATDKFWNDRAKKVSYSNANIDDLAQRELENKFILRELDPGMRVLEVGCGNGYLTQDIRTLVSSVVSFDFSEEMIEVAKNICGETNNRFHCESILNPEAVTEKFDAVLCVRVLINLAGTNEQKQAINNMANWLKPGGRLILVEGYSEGFDALSELRKLSGVSELKPAKINHYSPFKDLKKFIKGKFKITNSWNSGFYDVMTRAAYPLLVGEKNANGPGEFHASLQPLLAELNGQVFEEYARLHGISAIKK